MSSDAATAFSAANELFLADDFDSAAPLFDEACRLAPQVTSYRLNRAANSIKRKDYTGALADCDAVLSVEPSSAVCLYRRGTALFFLDRYEEAKAAFTQAEQAGSRQAQLWIRKCDAEMQRTASCKTAKTATAPTAAAAPVEQSAPAVAPSSSSLQPQPPAASASSARVSENWFQSPSAVTLTLFAKGLKRDSLSVSVSPSDPRIVTARLTLADGSAFQKDWRLFGAVQPEPRLELTAYRLEIILSKQHHETWDGLLDSDRKKEAVVKRDNVISAASAAAPAASSPSSSSPPPPAAAPLSYPTSSKKKVEWTAVESEAKRLEEEEKPEGDAALQRLFQQIYRDASDDTRRAMVKSFQTSGGTVLSTNWADVSKTDYSTNREAPKGQEFRDWNDPNK